MISDVIRLLAIPILLWAAWSDIKIRRVPNKTWIPILAIAFIALSVDVLNIYNGTMTQPNRFIRVTFMTIIVVIPFSLFAYSIGGFGGADVKALMVFAILFPNTPSFITQASTYPMITATHEMFPLTIFGNALLLSFLLIPTFIVINIVNRNFSPVMFIGLPRNVTSLNKRFGSLLETQDGFTRSGTDLDILNGYVKWVNENEKNGNDEENAEMFLSDQEFTYGVTSDKLVDSYKLINSQKTVWVSPGTPFFVPLCVGLFIGLTYGDIIISLTNLIGL